MAGTTPCAGRASWGLAGDTGRVQTTAEGDGGACSSQPQPTTPTRGDPHSTAVRRPHDHDQRNSSAACTNSRRATASAVPTSLLAGVASLDEPPWSRQPHGRLGRQQRLADVRRYREAHGPGLDPWLEADGRLPHSRTGAVSASRQRHPRAHHSSLLRLDLHPLVDKLPSLLLAWC